MLKHRETLVALGVVAGIVLGWAAARLGGREEREPARAAEALERLRTACMKCHVAEDVPYFTVDPPEHRLAPIRSRTGP
jgi:hypothetical protein